MSNLRIQIPLFLVPLYSIVIFNTVAFILVVRVLIIQRNKRAKKSPKREPYCRVITGITSVMIVYGIFWGTGIVNIGEASIYFQWPFLFLNSLQGVLIFLLIGVYNTNKEWRRFLHSKKKREIETASSTTTKFNRRRVDVSEKEISFSMVPDSSIPDSKHESESFIKEESAEDDKDSRISNVPTPDHCIPQPDNQTTEAEVTFTNVYAESDSDFESKINDFNIQTPDEDAPTVESATK